MADLYKIQYANNTLTYPGWNGFLSYSQTESILDFYPVGTLYKTVNADFDPNVTFGGTWSKTKFAGKTPVGANGSLVDNGGEKTHTLTMAECPSHTHNTSRVTFSNFENDKQTSNWNRIKPTGGSGPYEKVANGRLTTSTTTSQATHNNIQKSMIVIIWERIE